MFGVQITLWPTVSKNQIRIGPTGELKKLLFGNAVRPLADQPKSVRLELVRHASCLKYTYLQMGRLELSKFLLVRFFSNIISNKVSIFYIYLGEYKLYC